MPARLSPVNHAPSRFVVPPHAWAWVRELRPIVEVTEAQAAVQSMRALQMVREAGLMSRPRKAT